VGRLYERRLAKKKAGKSRIGIDQPAIEDRRRQRGNPLSEQHPQGSCSSRTTWDRAAGLMQQGVSVQSGNFWLCFVDAQRTVDVSSAGFAGPWYPHGDRDLRAMTGECCRW